MPNSITSRTGGAGYPLRLISNTGRHIYLPVW